jgi:predicted transcriptional regulator
MKDEILKLREEGLTYNQIVDKLGCSKGTVSYYCRKNGVTRYDNSVNLSNDIIKNLQDEYDNGSTLKKLAVKYNVGRHIIRKYITIKNKKIYETEEDVKKSKSRHVIYWRQRAKLKLIEYKGGKCQVESCGYNKSVRSLGFHHIDPREKDFSISGKTISLDKMKKELDKCLLVCNNCHGEIHEEIDYNGYSEIVNKIIK